jgi:hypothetical protein
MLCRALALALLMSSLGLVTGCGSSQSTTPSLSPEQLNAVNSREELKQRLQAIVNSGTAGSALAGMKSGIEALKATDEKLAIALLVDFEKLEKANGPAQTKSLAKKMADSL